MEGRIIGELIVGAGMYAVFKSIVEHIPALDTFFTKISKIDIANADHAFVYDLCSNVVPPIVFAAITSVVIDGWLVR